MIAAISDLGARLQAFDAQIDTYGPVLAYVGFAITLGLVVLSRPGTPTAPRAVWLAGLGILFACILVGARHTIVNEAWGFLS